MKSRERFLSLLIKDIVKLKDILKLDLAELKASESNPGESSPA